MAVRRRRKSKHIMSDDSSDNSSADSSASSSSDSESESSSSSESDSSASSSSESDDSGDSGSEEGTSGPDFDDSVFPNEDPKKSVEEIRELIRDAKVMKYENAIIEKAGVDNYASLRNCDEKKLKKLGMGYTDRDRLLKAFRTHIEAIIEQNRERWERQKELKSGKGKKTTKNSKSKSKSKSTKNGKDKKRAKSKSSKSSKTSSKSSKTKGKAKTEVDPDEALKKLDDGWSGKKQAWKDYKLHEARVAELMEFYDEIGKKRANGEEHARRLLLSYPGGIHKLVIALDKKYHHIPYGWEELLEEAYRVQEYEGSGTD